MAELVERYVHQVGRYLPPKERAEIEAELRSQIQDQLDDRYGGAPTPEETASVLAEFGHPYTMAASYSRERYLVGPILYPYMMMILRYVWLIVPSIVVFMNIFGALSSSSEVSWLTVLVETVYAAAEATLIVSALVVLFFALIQHSYLKIDADEPFKPLELPEVDDPTRVDRFETAFGIAFGAFVTLFWFYFISVGGLALPFNRTSSGDVIPVPGQWLILITINTIVMLVLNIIVLRRNRWNVGLWLVETLLELFGTLCLYFVLFEPIWQRIVISLPDLADVPMPELLVVLSALTTIVGRGPRLIKLLGYGNTTPMPFTIKSDG